MGLVSLPPTPGLTYRREIFKASGTFTLPTTAQNKFDAILISGGGGGGRTQSTSNAYNALGGGTGLLYVKDVFCTNGTTLTITIGAGGAGAISPSTSAASEGSVSTISGISGNGVSTSISSPISFAGRGFNRNSTSISAGLGVASDVTAIRNQYNGGNTDRGGNRGIGLGNMSITTGAGHDSTSRTMFQNIGSRYTSGSGSSLRNTDSGGHQGGPIPLLGNYLHATAGGTGTNGNTTNGSGSNANSFISGSGGGSNGYGGGYNGSGGGGGAGGFSTGSNLSGNGGAGSINSGGGGGSAGRNLTSAFNGSGASGGSGLVIIGYWS